MDLKEILLKDVASDDAIYIETMSGNVYRLSYEDSGLALRSGRVSSFCSVFSVVDIHIGTFEVGKRIKWEGMSSTRITRIIRLRRGEVDEVADRFKNLSATGST